MRGRVIAALVLITVGLLFLMANMGLASIDRVGAAVGNVAGNFGQAIGEFFRLWPLLLIIAGLALIVRRPGDRRKPKRESEE